MLYWLIPLLFAVLFVGFCVGGIVAGARPEHDEEPMDWRLR